MPDDLCMLYTFAELMTKFLIISDCMCCYVKLFIG